VVAMVLGNLAGAMIWGEVPVAQGLVAMGTVMLAHLCVVYASFRSIRFDQLVGSGPVPVLRDGRTLRDGLRRARMNTGDLDVQLRLHGRENPREVAEALLEPNGEVSLRPTEDARTARHRDLDRAA